MANERMPPRKDAPATPEDTTGNSTQSTKPANNSHASASDTS